MSVELESRVENLETVLAQFMSQTSAAILRLERSDQALKKGLLAFKNEMRDFKDEMLAFKDEMRAFKDEMRVFKDEMNKKWGDLANKTGKMVEDLVYPSFERIVREQFDLELERIDIRVKIRLKDGSQTEYDAIAVAEDLIFINSTRSSLNKRDVDDLLAQLMEFRKFLPEYREKKAVGVLASLGVDESVLRYAEKKGFLVLAVGSEIMEVKNSKGFRVKTY